MATQKKRLFVVFIVLALSLATWLSATAGEYPTKSISLIIPYMAGGYTDLVSRALANSAKKELGQPIICENKAGGGATVGLGYVASRPSDGYTIGTITPGVLIGWHMGKTNFHPINDLTFVSRISGALMGIAVRTDSPWKTLQDVIKYAKENPGKVTYGASGMGTITHLAMEELSSVAGGVPWKLMPYKSGAEASTAVLGGHVDLVSDAASWVPLVDAGKLRLLAVYTEKRSIRYPDVPTVKECGFNMACPGPMGIVGPKGLPKQIVQKLDSAFKKTLEDPEVQAVLKQFDATPLYLSSEAYLKSSREEFDWSGRLVEKLGLAKK